MEHRTMKKRAFAVKLGGGVRAIPVIHLFQRGRGRGQGNAQCRTATKCRCVVAFGIKFDLDFIVGDTPGTDRYFQGSRALKTDPSLCLQIMTGDDPQFGDQGFRHFAEDLQFKSKRQRGQALLHRLEAVRDIQERMV